MLAPPARMPRPPHAVNANPPMIRPVLFALAVVLTGLPAQARLIRDAEIEYALRQLARPVLEAAGLPGRIRILVIDDDRMNAFVADASTIFIHSGLILRTTDAAMLQAVIAHEAAHIANGHLTRRATAVQGASTAAKVGIALSLAAAAVAGGEAGLGLAAGTASAAQRRLFAHSRAEEASADQSAARFMASAGIDPQAAVRVLDLFRGQEALSTGRQDPYAQTHPLTRDRIRAAEGFAVASRVAQRDRSGDDFWHMRAAGKLSAFLRAPSWTLRRMRGRTDETSVMRRAVAHHRTPDADRAIRTVDALIAARPDDPFYRELRGQILLESRRPAAAVEAYVEAVRMAPRQPLIRARLGRALLAAGRAGEAAEVLERARADDPVDPATLRDLATAQAQVGDLGRASVATAERYAVTGRLQDAAIHAQRAAGLLPQGSAEWLRAQDVMSAARAAERR